MFVWLCFAAAPRPTAALTTEDKVGAGRSEEEERDGRRTVCTGDDDLEEEDDDTTVANGAEWSSLMGRDRAITGVERGALLS